MIAETQFAALGLIAIGAAIAVGVASAGSGIGQGTTTREAIERTAKNQNAFGKMLAMSVLVQTQALYGFAIAFILIAFGFGLIII
ncbi:MAG: V-type ATP synthase subunit K [DPANN group archaeon]|nr:V-type ATP synthase subunit K [DPANN group archaeon]